jgi:NADPH-dependent 2,4-dienoyl-CoA reductase/sulfur reductase-like enzyme
VLHKPKRVIIAGGGVAGMEGARSSALKGHEVILYEKSEKLGGHLIAGSVPEFKQDTRRLLYWYENQLKRLGIEIRLQVEATPLVSTVPKYIPFRETSPLPVQVLLFRYICNSRIPTLMV